MKTRIEEHFPLNKLESVDISAQRPLDARRAEKISKNYAPERAGVITLGERPDGSYYIIDGQHRAAANRLANGAGAVMPAFIVEDSNLALEAELFAAINTQRKAVPQVDTYRAEVTAGVKDAVELRDFLESVNLVIGTSDSGRQISAVAATRHAFRRNPGALKATIITLIEGFGYERDTWNGNMIAGVWRVFDKAPHLDRERLVGHLRKHPASWWLTAATSGTHGGSASGMGGNSLALAQYIANDYDKGLRTNRLNLRLKEN